MMHKGVLSESESLSVYYHNIFDYPLSSSDLIKWKCKMGLTSITDIASKNGYFFVKGKENLINQRQNRERISARKLEIAKKAARILSIIPTVLMVAVTGSLAMMNSSRESDIDLMIITKKGTLWTTRVLSYMVTHVCGLRLRTPNNLDQKDRLCLNIWLDETDIIWHKKDRNIYTAHEIAQVVSLINKNETYEKFIFSNNWILSFWPNAVKIGKLRGSESWKLESFAGYVNGNSTSASKINIFEQIAYKIQLTYMKRKISREVVTPSRALFHPHDWGKVVLKKLSS